MADFNCALCGVKLTITRPSGDRNHFCKRSHKEEYHNNLKLSQAQVDVLEMLEHENRILPKSNTVYMLSTQNKKRVKPLLKFYGNSEYGITEEGRKFLKLMLDKKQKRV